VVVDWYCIPESELEMWEELSGAVDEQEEGTDEWYEAIAAFITKFDSIGTSPDCYKRNHPELRFG